MPTKLTAIIVDNEQDARESLEQLIKNNLPDVEVTYKAGNAPDALALVIDKHPDLLFLDIQMPVYDGFWLADKLGNFENGTSIIFITAYDEYAIEAIKHAAFDFLTKPIAPDELKKAVERYKNGNNKGGFSQKLEKLTSFFNQSKLKLNTQSGFIMVKPEDIVYCEASGNYCILHLTNGKEKLISMHLGLLEENLPHRTFLRINRSTTINLDYIDGFNRKTKQVILQDIIQKYELKASRSGTRRLMEI